MSSAGHECLTLYDARTWCPYGHYVGLVTFAIAARTEDGWAIGAATYPMNVGRNVLCALPGTGVALTMNYAPASAGEGALAAMASGMAEEDALAAFGTDRPQWSAWQLALVGRHRSATALGSDHLPFAGSVCEPDMVAAANLMRTEGVPEAMAEAWRSSSGLPPRTRVQLALEAGRDAGGDLRGMHSAALALVGDAPDGDVAVAEVNYDPGDPIAALHETPLLPLVQRSSKEERFDCLLTAWAALSGGDEASAAAAFSAITNEARGAYPGSVMYLELVQAVRSGADVGQFIGALGRTHPEWLTYAERGGDFGEEVLRSLREHSGNTP